VGETRALRIDILTLFPDVFEPVLRESITGRARDAGLIEWIVSDIRRYTTNKHGKVDDRPFGGGPGMVMACQPLWDAVQDVEKQDDRTATRVLLTPQGRPLDQPLVNELAMRDRLLLIAGHYEGIDERVIEKLEPMEVSVGDYVLSGGEIPAMLIVDAIGRVLPGALGHELSASEDSFSQVGSDGQPLLDCPHYTRPRQWMGMDVPEVLIGGNHREIEEWRRGQMIERTQQRRPDLTERRRTQTHDD